MEAKGTALQAIQGFVKTTHGEDGSARWIEALSPAAKGIYSGRVLASTWYPMRQAFLEPMKAVCDLFYRGSLEGARASGRYSAEKGLRGIYKVFVRLGSVESLVKRASAILPAYYRPSTMEVTEMQKGKALLRLTQFEEADDLVDARIRGWMEAALEVSGCSTGRVTIGRSLAKGDAYTEFRVSWL